ncbi:di-trans,poly-cis-decaprenylcistransferase [Candidatus Woesearchaeota archaeon]|nr:di-trans,poly-cis-decaprenylcistransferase [Candidatus Woesearchaeota archaeon]
MKNPKHIAIILDGNRRFARKKKLNKWQGHEAGGRKIKDLLKWCQEVGVKELTLYTFSTENFNRDKKEVGFLMNLFRKQIKKLKDDPRIDKNKIKVRFIGRLSLFPKDLQKEMEEVMKKTSRYGRFKLNFAMGYGGRQEIVDAVNKLLRKGVRKANEKTLGGNLYMADEPDLLIRPGGELRISNFLLWQMAYSEFYFTDKLWPEFTKKDLVKAIEEYKRRKRRFGK